MEAQTHPVEVTIRDQTIDLDQFLKLAGAAQSGGHAKALIQDGCVSVNGDHEMRRRRTLKVGDVIRVEHDQTYLVGGQTTVNP